MNLLNSINSVKSPPLSAAVIDTYIPTFAVSNNAATTLIATVSNTSIDYNTYTLYSGTTAYGASTTDGIIAMTGLTENTAYSFFIVASNDTGGATVSSDTSVVYTAPAAPVVTKSTASNSIMTIVFSGVTADTYNLYWDGGSSLNNTSTTIEINSLTKGTTYKVYGTVSSSISGLVSESSVIITPATANLLTDNAVYIFQFNSGKIAGQTIVDYKTGDPIIRSDCTMLNATTSTADPNGVGGRYISAARGELLFRLSYSLRRVLRGVAGLNRQTPWHRKIAVLSHSRILPRRLLAHWLTSAIFRMRIRFGENGRELSPTFLR